MYQDPYDLYGRLSMDMFLSVRLVVDTGMNALGWPRARAVAFMREHLMESDTQIETESLRYSVDIPGQALAYKMGSRGLWELRAARKPSSARASTCAASTRPARQWLAAAESLERHVDWWIAQEKTR